MAEPAKSIIERFDVRDSEGQRHRVACSKRYSRETGPHGLTYEKGEPIYRIADGTEIRPVAGEPDASGYTEERTVYELELPDGKMVKACFGAEIDGKVVLLDIS